MKNNIISGLKWDFVGKMLNQSFGFIVTIVLARLLEPDDFALLAMVSAFSAFVNGFVNFGYTSALIQKKNIKDDDIYSVFYFNIVVAIFISLLFYLSAPLIATFYNNLLIEPIAKLLSLTFVLSSFGLVPWALLAKNLEFKLRMNVSVISGFVSGLFGIIFAFSGFGVWSLVFQVLINELLRSLLSIFYNNFQIKFLFSITSLKSLSKFGVPVFVSGLINSIFSKIDYLIIGKFFPVTLLGLLYRAKSFRTLIIRYSSDSLGKVLFPVYSKKQDDIAWVSSITNFSLKTTFYIIIFLSMLLFLVGEEMFVILFSEKWLGAVPYFKILILSSVTFPMISILGNVLIGLGKSTRFLFLDMFEKIGLLIGIVLAVYKNNLLLYLYIDFIIRLISFGIFYFHVNKVIFLNNIDILFSFLSSIVITFFSFFIVHFILSIFIIENIWLIIIFKGVVFISLFYIFSEVDQRLQKNSNLHLIKSFIKNYKS